MALGPLSKAGGGGGMTSLATGTESLGGFAALDRSTGIPLEDRPLLLDVSPIANAGKIQCYQGYSTTDDNDCAFRLDYEGSNDDHVVHIETGEYADADYRWTVYELPDPTA